jgi:hypothetical protein
MTSPGPLPGAGRGPAGGLYAWLLDGSLDATGARELFPEDYTVLDVATAVIRIAVRTRDGNSAGPDRVLTVLRTVRDAARAQANDWHLEDYRFAGWDHLPWSRSRTARYRLIQVRHVVPRPQGRRWALIPGPVVPDLPGRARGPGPCAHGGPGRTRRSRRPAPCSTGSSPGSPGKHWIRSSTITGPWSRPPGTRPMTWHN